jgi:putative phage-type endonuclease
VDYICKRETKIEEYKVQLSKIMLIPKIEQRTPAWYDARKLVITASDFAQALGDGKFGSQDQFIKKKCGYEEEVFNASCPPLKWGTMFEPVASEVYSMRNKMVLHEFGLLKHPSITHLAASPDGINDCGIMVEIKCPFKRKINGEVPLQYLYQIQAQLDVCGLEECDYFECEFAADQDIDVIFDNGFEKGAIIELENMEYVYSPVYSTIDQDKNVITKWVNERIIDKVVVNVVYYSLMVCSTRRVYKDPSFLTEKYHMLENVWARICEYRRNEDMYNNEIKKKEKSFGPVKLTGYAFKS